jgi:catechol 2,3-dioxygenase-like lactoylglutathione lyase family enzyme
MRRSLMKGQQAPLANVITLGVRDLAAERDFYSGLGCRCTSRGGISVTKHTKQAVAEEHICEIVCDTVR